MTVLDRGGGVLARCFEYAVPYIKKIDINGVEAIFWEIDRLLPDGGFDLVTFFQEFFLINGQTEEVLAGVQMNRKTV